MTNGYATPMMRATSVLLLVCVLAGCGGEDANPAPAAKAKAKTAPKPKPPADGIDTVAERAMEEVPGCTPDETSRIHPSWKKAGVVAIRTGVCEDKVLDGVTIFEFRDAKAARASQEDYALIDDPSSKDGPVVGSGNVRCHEQTRRRRDAVNCMLRLREYILIAHGRLGVDTDGVMNKRMAALGRAAE